MLGAPRAIAPPPPMISEIQKQPLIGPVPLPSTNRNVEAFKQVSQQMKDNYPHQLATKFPASRHVLGF